MLKYDSKGRVMNQKSKQIDNQISGISEEEMGKSEMCTKEKQQLRRIVYVFMLKMVFVESNCCWWGFLMNFQKWLNKISIIWL